MDREQSLDPVDMLDTFVNQPTTLTMEPTVVLFGDTWHTHNGRVEDWRAGLGRSSCFLLSRSFVCECHSISAMPRFQSPPRRTQHADFPLYALLFASPQGLWDLSCRGDFRP